jgi:hypothetical protein
MFVKKMIIACLGLHDAFKGSITLVRMQQEKARQAAPCVNMAEGRSVDV